MRKKELVKQNEELLVKVEKQNIIIEKLQKDFVKKIFTEKKLQKQLAVAIDLISLHGAMSRKVASGKSEEVFLSYPIEFLTSEYSFNLEFFANNVRIKKGKFIT